MNELNSMIIKKIEIIKNARFLRKQEFRFFEDLYTKIEDGKYVNDISNIDMLTAIMTFNDKGISFKEIDKILNSEDIIYNIYDNIMLSKLISTIVYLKEEGLYDKYIALEVAGDAEIDSLLDNFEKLNENEKVEIKGYMNMGSMLFNSLDILKNFSDLVLEIDSLDKLYEDFINYKEKSIEVKNGRLAEQELVSTPFYPFLDKIKSNYFEFKRKKEFAKYNNLINYIKKDLSNEEFNNYRNKLMEVKNGSLAEEELVNSPFYPFLGRIKEHYFFLKKENKSFEIKRNKEIIKYENLSNYIKESLSNENLHISKNDERVKAIKDVPIKNKLFLKILEHNEKIYNKISEENKKLDKYNEIEILFLKYNFALNLLDEESQQIIIDSLNKEDLEKILNCLSSEGFSWLDIKHPNFVEIIINTTPDILSHLSNLVEEKILTSEFLEKNIGILLNEGQLDNGVKALYPNFSKNFYILEELKNQLPYIIKNNPELVFIPNSKLKENIKLLKKYEINLELVKEQVYDYFIFNNLIGFDYIDEFIEMGYEDIIKNYVNFIRKDTQNILTRLRLVDSIGLDSINKNGRFKSMITNGKNFYVNDNELGKHYVNKANEGRDNNPYYNILKNNERNIIDEEIENHSIIKYLDEKFKLNTHEYRFCEKIISRMKVLRNLKVLAKYVDEDNFIPIILSAIAYNSTFELNELDEIKSELMGARKYIKEKM